MKDAIKIMVIFVPMTICAAFLESYVTHLMSETFDKDGKGGMPVWGSALILGGSLFFVIWYFIVYPILLEKKLKKRYIALSDSLIS